MTKNQPSLGRGGSKVGPSYYFTVLSHDYDNASIERNYSNEPCIANRELGSLSQDDNDGGNNIFMHLALHRLESSENVDIIDSV